MYESIACITTMLSSVTQALKDYSLNSGHGAACVSNEIPKQILDHAKACNIVDHLCVCLATTGSSLASGSSEMLRAACEACRATWSLIDASEIQHMKENGKQFPLRTMQNHHLLQHDIKDQERHSLHDSEPSKFVDSLAKSFLRSKGVQVAIYYCIRQRLEASLCAAIQV